MTMKLNERESFIVMVISYARSDKFFDGVFHQQKIVNAYAEHQGLEIDQEFIDQTSQNKCLNERDEAIAFLRPLKECTVLVFDIWVFSTHIDDLVQMMTCQLKNGNTIHFVNQSVIIDRNSDVLLVLGLIDQLRNTLAQNEKKAIGRPRGSRSSSKFDKYHDAIIEHIKEGKSVSEMARIFNVSRSSLKDYIESRELKEIARYGLKMNIVSNGAAKVLDTIQCPETAEHI
jgi:DNA invertase Pin-like site-specific DNA recombinase